MKSLEGHTLRNLPAALVLLLVPVTIVELVLDSNCWILGGRFEMEPCVGLLRQLFPPASPDGDY